MKNFLLSHHSGSKGAALIIVLALLAAVVSPISVAQQSPTPTSTPTCTPGPSPSPGCVAISSVQIAAAGNYGFRLRVASVDSVGRVIGVTVVPCIGIGYSAPPSNPIRFGGSPTGT